MKPSSTEVAATGIDRHVDCCVDYGAEVDLVGRTFNHQPGNGSKYLVLIAAMPEAMSDLVGGGKYIVTLLNQSRKSMYILGGWIHEDYIMEKLAISRVDAVVMQKLIIEQTPPF